MTLLTWRAVSAATATPPGVGAANVPPGASAVQVVPPAIAPEMHTVLAALSVRLAAVEVGEARLAVVLPHKVSLSADVVQADPRSRFAKHSEEVVIGGLVVNSSQLHASSVTGGSCIRVIHWSCSEVKCPTAVTPVVSALVSSQALTTHSPSTDEGPRKTADAVVPPYASQVVHAVLISSAVRLSASPVGEGGRAVVALPHILALGCSVVETDPRITAISAMPIHKGVLLNTPDCHQTHAPASTEAFRRGVAQAPISTEVVVAEGEWSG